MRSRNLVLYSVAAIALVAGVMTGCGSNSSGPSNPITNPEFTYMAAQTADVVDSLVGLTDLGLDMTVAATNDILTDLAFGPLPTDSSSIEDTWHIFVLTNSASGVTNAYIDSVQFLLNRHPRVNPAGANEMQFVRNWSSTADDTTVSYKNTEVHTILNAINTDDAAATIDGETVITVHDVDKSGTDPVVRDLTINGVVANYNVDRSNGWNAGCPISGTITIEATLAVTVGAAEAVSSDWTFQVTFEEGKTTVTATEAGKSVSYFSPVCE